jgi:lysozyme
MSQNLIRQLRDEEGEVLNAYQDHLGYWTIGVGRLIDKRKGGGITKEESEYLLNNDISKVNAQLDANIPWWRKLDEPRQAVLQGMAFQMGIANLLGFKNTLRMIEAADYEAAGKGMLNSLWAKQTPGRANRMSKQMKTGEWQWK